MHSIFVGLAYLHSQILEETTNARTHCPTLDKKQSAFKILPDAHISDVCLLEENPKNERKCTTLLALKNPHSHSRMCHLFSFNCSLQLTCVPNGRTTTPRKQQAPERNNRFTVARIFLQEGWGGVLKSVCVCVRVRLCAMCALHSEYAAKCPQQLKTPVFLPRTPLHHSPAKLVMMLAPVGLDRWSCRFWKGPCPVITACAPYPNMASMACVCVQGG